MLLGFLFRIVFQLFLIIFEWRECEWGKDHLIWKGRYKYDGGGGKAYFGCVGSGGL